MWKDGTILFLLTYPLRVVLFIILGLLISYFLPLASLNPVHFSASVDGQYGYFLDTTQTDFQSLKLVATPYQSAFLYVLDDIPPYTLGTRTQEFLWDQTNASEVMDTYKTYFGQRPNVKAYVSFQSQDTAEYVKATVQFHNEIYTNFFYDSRPKTSVIVIRPSEESFLPLDDLENGKVNIIIEKKQSAANYTLKLVIKEVFHKYKLPDNQLTSNWDWNRQKGKYLYFVSRNNQTYEIRADKGRWTYPGQFPFDLPLILIVLFSLYAAKKTNSFLNFIDNKKMLLLFEKNKIPKDGEKTSGYVKLFAIMWMFWLTFFFYSYYTGGSQKYEWLSKGGQHVYDIKSDYNAQSLKVIGVYGDNRVYSFDELPIANQTLSNELRVPIDPSTPFCLAYPEHVCTVTSRYAVIEGDANEKQPMVLFEPYDFLPPNSIYHQMSLLAAVCSFLGFLYSLFLL